MLKRFTGDDRGSVMPLFALSILPIFGFVGLAVDYSRANSARTAMQSALDSAALMLSRDAPNLSQAQLTQKANDYFRALYTRADVQNLALTATFETVQAGSFKVNLSGSGAIDTSFTRLFGQNQIQIGTTSEVAWGLKRLEVALALDNTGSMASHGKISELKKAVKSLLDTLQNAAKRPDDVKVAIIPFDTTVSIGKNYKNEPWIDYSVNNIKKKKWQGCVEDRDQPNDVLDTTPVGESSYFPAADCSGALADVMPLTNDWDALRNRVNQMNPNGNTNVTIGLVWAWHALTQNLPLTEASAPTPDLDKVIVLLTDGENTQNRWTYSTSAIDARTAAACSNIKAANVKIYTVRVIDGNTTLLKSCASSPGMYYDVQDASQLNEVFASIAQNLANLRVAK